MSAAAPERMPPRRINDDNAIQKILFPRYAPGALRQGTFIALLPVFPGPHHTTPCTKNAQYSATAKTPPPSVARKLVPALPRNPLFSRSAPIRLSRLVPTNPVIVQMTSIHGEMTCNPSATSDTTKLRPSATSSPVIVTPPFVPIGTLRSVVIM